MNFFKKLFSKKTKKRKHRKPKSKLKEQAIEKLDEVWGKEFTEESLSNFAAIFRIYLAKRLGVKRQMTHRELISNLRNKKVQALVFDELERISMEIEKYEYAGEVLTKEEFSEIIRRFKDVLEVY